MKKQSQRGMTTIGLIIIIAVVGMILLTGFKILPMYLDYFNVKSVMDSVATDPEIDARSKRDLWTALSKRLYINQIRDMKQEDFSFVRENEKTTITVDYEVRKPYVADLFIGANFVYSVEINR